MSKSYMELSADTERTYAEKLRQARERYGRPFAHEPGSDYKPQSEPFLTRWLRELHAEEPSCP